MLSVTKKFSFCYGHHLPDYVGLCKNFHGHNANVEVEFSEAATRNDTYPGMVVDFHEIKNVVSPLLVFLDHQYLNEVLPEPYLPPTAEHITSWLRDKILETPLGNGLVRVRVSETDNAYAEWRKDA